MKKSLLEYKVIAKIHTDFQTKFGIPRQSGLVEGLTGRIVMEPPYRSAEAFRGLEGFSHIWILWDFSENKREHWSATVKPPRLGGKTRLGVFATRSPFRPNSIGLSCVKIIDIQLQTPDGPVLVVEGADLLDGTPILDIKPYIPIADCHPEAREGFTAYTKEHNLEVEFPEELLRKLPEEKREAAIGILAQDPRPGYDTDTGRIYGVDFAGFDLRFTVSDRKLKVVEVVKMRTKNH